MAYYVVRTCGPLSFIVHSVARKFPTPWHRQAFQAFLTCLLLGQLPYGPLLGWGWLTGRNFWVPTGADYPCPDAKVGERHGIAEARRWFGGRQGELLLLCI